MTSRILLADDSITIQKVVNLTFADEGIEVVAVSNGDTAEKRLGEVRPDLVLADIFMPGKNGYELCEIIKQSPQFRHVPVVLLVGAFEPFDQMEARRVQADAHLTKPFESRTLVETVRDLISKSGSIRPEPAPETRSLRDDTPAFGTPPITQSWAAPEIPPAEAPAQERASNTGFLSDNFPLDLGHLSAEPADTRATVALHSLPETFMDSGLAPAAPRERATADLVSPTLDNPLPIEADGFSASAVDSAAQEGQTSERRGSGVPSAFGTQAQDVLVDFEQVEEPQSVQPENLVSFDVAQGYDSIADAPPRQEERNRYDTADLEDETPEKPAADTSAWDSAGIQEPTGFGFYEDKGFDLPEHPEEAITPTALLALDDPLGDVLTGARPPEAPESEDILQVEEELRQSTAPLIVYPEAAPGAGELESQQVESAEVSPAPALSASEELAADSTAEPPRAFHLPKATTGGLADAGWAEPRETDYGLTEQQPAAPVTPATQGFDASPFAASPLWAEQQPAETPQAAEAVTPDEPETGFDFAPTAAPQAEEIQAQATAPLQPETAGVESRPAAELSEAVMEEIVRRVVARMSEAVVREIAWEVVPDCVERIVKEETRQALSK